MSIGTLYGQVGNPRASKAIIVAELSDVKLDLAPDFTMKDTKTESYLKKFPLGQAPGFESADGKLLTESCAIAYFVADQKPNNSLLGKDSWERAEILRYTLLSEAQLLVNSLDILYPYWGIRKYDKEAVDRSTGKFYANLDMLDKTLAENGSVKQYIVGNRLTLADIELVTALLLPYVHFMTPELREKYPNLTQYFLKHAETDVFKKSLTSLKDRGLCKEPIVYKQ